MLPHLNTRTIGVGADRSTIPESHERNRLDAKRKDHGPLILSRRYAAVVRILQCIHLVAYAIDTALRRL